MEKLTKVYTAQMRLLEYLHEHLDKFDLIVPHYLILLQLHCFQRAQVQARGFGYTDPLCGFSAAMGGYWLAESEEWTMYLANLDGIGRPVPVPASLALGRQAKLL
ncbi:uncharacterized protein LOC135820833 [Sycon ciliatum]|uniref:uncharacterized protein LOC135820833 n=1 Tax=Sycon ciliatum TaxID=27933 RepID=UPI0031F603BE